MISFFLFMLVFSLLHYFWIFVQVISFAFFYVKLLQDLLRTVCLYPQYRAIGFTLQMLHYFFAMVILLSMTFYSRRTQALFRLFQATILDVLGRIAHPVSTVHSHTRPLPPVYTAFVQISFQCGFEPITIAF